MSDINTPRRPGPWDLRPEDTAAAPPPRADAASSTSAHAAVRGQSPGWALISTLLLGGLIYYWTRSVEIVAAVLFGVLIHEIGHMLAMNRLGMGPARIFIVPFFGGAAVGQRPARSEWHGVLVSLAGPAFGLVAAVPFFILYGWTGQAVWLQCVLVIAFLNLVNLIPAPMLDGSKALGPVLAKIHPMVERAVLLAIGAVAILWGASNGMWLFVVFLGIALFTYLKRDIWRPEMRPLTWGEAAKSTGLFVLTAVACLGVGLAAILPGAETVAAAAGHGATLFEFGN